MSEINELDFEQPRVLWQRVFDDDAKARFGASFPEHLSSFLLTVVVPTVDNVAGHISAARDEIIARQLSVFATVDQDLADRIAKAVGKPSAKPLSVKKASEAHRFQANVGRARL